MGCRLRMEDRKIGVLLLEEGGGYCAGKKEEWSNIPTFLKGAVGEIDTYTALPIPPSKLGAENFRMRIREEPLNI